MSFKRINYKDRVKSFEEDLKRNKSFKNKKQNLYYLDFCKQLKERYL